MSGYFYRLLFLFYLVTLFISCSEEKTIIPAGVMSRDSMIMVMADMHIAEAQLVNAGHNIDINKMKQEHIAAVLEKYNMSFDDYNRSFEFYTMHPRLFNEMYEDVIVIISQKQAEYKSTVQENE